MNLIHLVYNFKFWVADRAIYKSRYNLPHLLMSMNIVACLHQTFECAYTAFILCVVCRKLIFCADILHAVSSSFYLNRWAQIFNVICLLWMLSCITINQCQLLGIGSKICYLVMTWGQI